MSRRNRLRLACLLAVALLVLLDQWSKSAVFAWLASSDRLVRDVHGHERYPLVGR